MAKTDVTMKVNGAEVEGLVEPRTLLVHFIRENLQLTGTHIGCETTHCGACTVDLDGMSVKSCTVFAVQANGSEIMTVEGVANADGSWSYSPQQLRIRDAQGHALWTHHPSRDVAAIAITAPPAFAKAAIPEDYLAADDTFSKYNVAAGDQMMTLGFPRGLAANSAGFPILRAGRVALASDSASLQNDPAVQKAYLGT